VKIAAIPKRLPEPAIRPANPWKIGSIHTLTLFLHSNIGNVTVQKSVKEILMDKHFAAALIAMEQATKAISASNPDLIKDVSMDGDNKSAEILFSVRIDGEKKDYILKIEEMEEATCDKCGSWLNAHGYCKNQRCEFHDQLQTEDTTGDGH